MRGVVKNIGKIFRNLKKNPVDTRLLGRWTVDHNEESAFRRADLTNEDHCGVCSEIREKYIEKQSEKNTENTKIKFSYNYQLPYII